MCNESGCVFSVCNYTETQSSQGVAHVVELCA